MCHRSSSHSCRSSNSSRTPALCTTSTWTRSWRWTWTRRPWRPCLARTWPVTLTFWECGSRRYWTGQHGCVWFYATALGAVITIQSLTCPHTLTTPTDLRHVVKWLITLLNPSHWSLTLEVFAWGYDGLLLDSFSDHPMFCGVCVRSTCARRTSVMRWWFASFARPAWPTSTSTWRRATRVAAAAPTARAIAATAPMWTAGSAASVAAATPITCCAGPAGKSTSPSRARPKPWRSKCQESLFLSRLVELWCSCVLKTSRRPKITIRVFYY